MKKKIVHRVKPAATSGAPLQPEPLVPKPGPAIPDLIPKTTGGPEPSDSLLELTSDNLVRGVIFAEILGRPKFRRGLFGK